MVKYLSKFNLVLNKESKSLATSILLVINFLVCSNVCAETLTDPTLPPVAFDSRSKVELEAVMTLQSVMRGPNYQAAIINGKKVLLGEKYGGATLIRLSENEATLRNADMTMHVLKMEYNINKKLVNSAEPIQSHTHSKAPHPIRMKKQGN